jgi:predicted nucleotidyltransferase
MLSLFGSALKGADSEESDVDLLVEFEPETAPGLIGLAAIERELSEVFGGRRVDLRTPNDLSPYFRGEILRLAEVQYAGLSWTGVSSCHLQLAAGAIFRATGR